MGGGWQAHDAVLPEIQRRQGSCRCDRLRFGQRLPATALTPGQARDALAAIARLQAFCELTGRKISPLTVASECAEAAARQPHGCTLSNALDGYLHNVAAVKPKDIREAAGVFVAVRKPLAKPKQSSRSQRGLRLFADPGGRQPAKATRPASSPGFAAFGETFLARGARRERGNHFLTFAALAFFARKSLVAVWPRGAVAV